MTNTTNIYFREVGDAYVNVGEYQFTEYTKKGVTPIQGAYQAGVNPVVRDLEQTPIRKGVYVGAESHNWPLKTDAEIESNPDAFVDNAAYASGTYVTNREYQAIPRFRAVKLFYFYKQDGSHDLVQFDTVTYDTVKGENDPTAEEYLSGLNARVFTEDEYLAFCGAKGFVTYGNALPKGFSYSSVNELSCLNIELVSLENEDELVIPTLPVYVTPIWIQNSRPIFSQVYIEMDTLSILEESQLARKAHWAGIPDRILRWQGGGLKSDYIAPINRDGSAVSSDSYLNKMATVTIDGVTYFNANEFAVNTMPGS